MSKNVEAIYPLTPAQHGMLFHTLLAPQSGVYVQQLKARLHGDLDRSSFERAWQTVLERHPSLRSAFVHEGLEEPMQVVGRQVSLPIAVVDDCDTPEAIENFLARDQRQGFTLTRAPLMRLTLLRHSDASHTLVWTHHHIIVDGWSVAQLLQEVVALYEAYRIQTDPGLPRCRPFGDYVGWLKRQDPDAAREFWQRYLGGFVEPTHLPQTATGRSGGGAHKRTQCGLGPGIAPALARYARAHRVTPNTIVQGAWATVLSQHCRSNDVVFGVTTSGRPPELKGVETAVGLFVNTLPLRVIVSADMPVSQWLQELQQQQAEQRQFEYMPLNEVQRLAGLGDGVQLFDTLIAFENYPVLESRSEQPTLRLSDVETRDQTNYPFNLLVLAQGEEITLRVAYDDSRVRPDVVEALLQQLRHAVADIVLERAATCGQVSILSDAERERVLLQWNDTDAEFDRTGSLPELIDRALAQTPDKVAVVDEHAELTCEQLRLDSNRFARELQTLGIGAGSRVGVHMHRSTDLMIALLGILKAGAAYVPLDPDYPPARLSYMVNDAGVGLVITDSIAGHGSDTFDGCRVLALDEAWSSIQRQSGAPVGAVPAPQSLAYIIFTSGSTGQPKGVMNDHRGICNRLVWMQDRFALNDGDCVLQKTPLGFDVSVWELFLPLMTGARLAMARPGGHRDPAYMADAIERYAVTTLHFVPSMLAIFLEQPGLEGRCNSLQRVICSGEALPWRLTRLFSEFSAAELHNLYGPTEAAVDVSHWYCENDERWPGIVPIGAPIANTRLYVLDADRRPVPPSVPGELYIGGVQVAQGYVNKPGLTAARFVPDPFGTSAGSRLYRTGDLVRWLPDGNLEYLGRIDSQVKVGGVRIEPGEIENQLETHPEVAQAAVVAYDSPTGDKALAAFVIAIAPAGTTDTADANASSPQTQQLIEALPAYLRERLPASSVPAHVQALREMPLSANGKIDRRALPSPRTFTRSANTGYVAPRSQIESVLVQAWQDVLGVARVGIHDNFFNLGGDSIRAIRVQSEARKKNVSFSLQALLATPRIADLAAAVETVGASGHSVDTEPFALLSETDRAQLGEDVEDAYPLTRMQAGMLFHSKLQPQTNVYHDVFTSHLRAPLDRDALQAAFDRLVGRHTILRTSFDLTGYSEPLQIVHRRASARIDFADWRDRNADRFEEHFADWFEAEKARRYDWRQPGLLRIAVHERSGDGFQFTLSFHHSILDGWSVAILMTELFQLYRERLAADEPVRLAAAPRSGMRELVAREAEALRSQETRDFWQAQLTDQPMTRLPRTPGYAGERQIRQHSVNVPQHIGTALESLARKLEVPLKSVLLTAHLSVLAATTGERSVVTGVVGSSRPETVDGDRALGLFLNNLPLRHRLGEGSWIDLVGRVHGQEQAVFANRFFPTAELVRMNGGSMLFETAFNFVHFHEYTTVRDMAGIEYVDGHFSQETDLTLLSNFIQDINDGGLRLALDFDLGQLTETQVERLGQRYLMVLEQIAAIPDAPLHAQPLIQATERAELDRWNDETTRPERFDLLHCQVAESARKHPDRIAVSCPTERLTYKQLNAEADALAQSLRLHGVGPDVRVGVCLERSTRLVVALLAVLKAGGAYVPLDPQYPARRIADVLEGAGIRLLLVDSSTATRLNPSVPTVNVDERHVYTTTNAGSDNSHTDVDESNLAYVIYTSGSTGKPKGVQITHRAICNLLEAMRERPSLKQDDVLLAVTTVAFDIAALELFLPLISGASVVVASREQATDATRLADVLEQHAVTVMQATPATWQMLLDSGWAGNAALTCLCGGEALPIDLARRLSGRCRALWNLYGPTETTVWSTVEAIEPGDEQISIGKPVANTSVYVLDRYLRALPVGAVGELYIGGQGLARGYRNRAALTAASFVPNPFATQAGERIYRTGDRVRRHADGRLEYVNRIDSQLKIRGYRIEPGEIEAAIRDFRGVQNAVVGVHPGVGATLLAGLLIDDEAEFDERELRESLAARLPEYMVPARFKKLAAFPSQPNGKLDRGAVIEQLVDAQPMAAARHIAPETTAERVVAEIWAQVLQIDQVGLRDNFFELGGHSISAIQLIARLSDAFQIELPLAGLFETPTVEAVLERLTEAWASREIVEQIAAIYSEVDNLSDEQVERQLA